MTPRPNPTNQFDLFRAHLNQILNQDHELCRIAWDRLNKEFADCYSEDMGRPGNAIGDKEATKHDNPNKSP